MPINCPQIQRSYEAVEWTVVIKSWQMGQESEEKHVDFDNCCRAF